MPLPPRGPEDRAQGAVVPAPRHPRLAASKLRWHCDLSRLNLRRLRPMKTDVGTVGQDRAIRALRMGCQIQGPGFNVFVSGNSGTGRTSAVKAVLREVRPRWSRLVDRCYVHNFKDPDRPRMLALEPGKGRALRSEMEELVSLLRRHIPLALEGEAFAAKRKALEESFASKERQIFKEFEERLTKSSLVLGQVQEGGSTRHEIFPVVDGKPYPLMQVEELIGQGRLTLAQARRFHELYAQFQPGLSVLHKRRRALLRETLKTLSELEKEAVRPVVDGLIDDVQERFEGESMKRYLEEVRESLLDSIALFKEQEEAEEGEEESQQESDGSEQNRTPTEDPMARYRVNLVLDNSETAKAPVIVETSPTFSNLFGTVEKVERGGYWHADFTGIRGGSILRADGGFLILNATDVLGEPNVWLTLKRVLRYRKLEIQAPESSFQPTPVALKPEPIDLKLKVILIGSPEVYEFLSSMDEDFDRIFKVKSEFDSEMGLNQLNMEHFARVVAKISREEGLRDVSKEALARIAEYAVRRAGRKRKITTFFSEIADVLREAHYWAHGNKEEHLGAKDVERALRERKGRLNMIENKLQELIDDNIILLNVEGARVGQVNGLWVIEMGSFAFGKPARITASTAPGRSGVINIEREVALSGSSHDKGVLIFSGYLRHNYTTRFPLALSASVCFEQSYSGIDGDSASMGELLAILSDLAGVPVRQSIAITGSVNQRGDVQAVGAINEKIEGFFKVCKRRGLSGEQGVIIPASTVDDIMLDGEVVRAVEDETFHIWPITRVEQAIELATGVAAGVRQDDGSYPPGSFHRRVADRLAEMAEIMRHHDSGR